MGRLDPSLSEIKMQCDAIDEAMNLFGVPATIWLPEELDLYGAPKSEARGIITNVVISDNPKKRTLNNLGWVPEHDGETPTLIYMPVVLNGVQVAIKDGSVIEFKDRTLMRVSSVNTAYLFGVYYTLNCVPFTQENKNIEKKTSSGAATRFLNSDQNEWGG